MNRGDNKGIKSLLSDDNSHYKKCCAELAHSRTLDDFQQRIHQRVKDLGFTDFLSIRLERCWPTGSQKGLLSSMPPMWLQCYQERRLYEVDLILSYGKANVEPIFSSQIYGYIDGAPFDIPFTHDNRRVLQLYKRLGYLEHYVVPTPAINGHGHVLLLLTSTDIEPQVFQDKVVPVMSRCIPLCRAIDTVSSQQFRSSFIQRCDQPLDISRTQLKVLRHLVREDCTISVLAEQLCISPITAHQHVAGARKALHVNTNIGSVVKAMRAGLITLY